MTDLIDGLLVFFPKYHQYQVLWIGQSDLIEMRAVTLNDFPAQCIEGKTELIVQL
ncbi:hypothetical protein D3C86_2072790 [compost metagenome]